MSAVKVKYEMPPVRQTLLLPGLSEKAMEAARGGPQERELLRLAQELLTHEPPTVLDKIACAPSDDMRDYLSLSIYFWPNPNTPDGLPYVARDGFPNPQIEDYNAPNLKRVAYAVSVFALAWKVCGRAEFAEAGARWLRAWFLDPQTGMKPNMNWAQFIPGDGPFDTPKDYPARFIPDKKTGKGIHAAFDGAIEGCELQTIPESAQMLLGSGHWSEAEHTALRGWFGEYLEWLHDSSPGADARACRNNHASWFASYAGMSAVFCGNEARAREILGEYCPRRLMEQISADGSQPEELYRATSFGYVNFTLYSFCNTAILAEKIGVDLWNYPSTDGSRLRKGIDWLLPYLSGGRAWDYRQEKPLEYYQSAPVMAAAYYAWGDAKYRTACRAALSLDPHDSPLCNTYRLLYAV